MARPPNTCAAIFQAAELPFNDANTILSTADGDLVVQCFSKIYPNFGHGYLHSSDHYAALKILLEREPTFREVYDSYHLAGSSNIDAARQKQGGGDRPLEWDSWSDEQKQYGVLVHRYGIKKGSRIFDGREKDPDPVETAKLLLQWGGTATPPEPEKPVDPPPTEKPERPIAGVLVLNVDGEDMVFSVVREEVGKK